MGYITDEQLREAHGWTPASARRMGIRRVVKIGKRVVLDTHAPKPKSKKRRKS